MNKNDFQKVIESTSIREVLMVSTNCTCHVHYSLVEPKHTMLQIKRNNIETKFITSKKTKKGTILSTINYLIEGISQKDIKAHDKKIVKKKDESLFTISASYVVTYDVNDINLKEDAVKYFGTENAYFNIYPYLREFVNHISQRFNLHPVVIPLLKPNSQSEEIVKKIKQKS